ncbi:hypothetical protein BDV96DRAFT_602226 [Lophiotrema nucula]|uniref:Uncharacterized protein n=1 Tax=Lophiotrema nucula TaxID=690887 RepID=A0A6A5YYQ5_9PLEO|nr:hypothetical protein BDV96DRAFT_602226 [Lophiotrema nucula]
MSRPTSHIDTILSGAFNGNARQMYRIPHSAALHARLLLQYGTIQRMKKEYAEQRISQLETKLSDTQAQLASTQKELAATQEALRIITDGWERGELIFWQQNDDASEEEMKARSHKASVDSNPIISVPRIPPRSAARQEPRLIDRSNQELFDPSPPGPSPGWSSPAHMHFNGHTSAELLAEDMKETAGGGDFRKWKEQMKAKDALVESQAGVETDAGSVADKGKEKAVVAESSDASDGQAQPGSTSTGD